MLLFYGKVRLKPVNRGSVNLTAERLESLGLIDEVIAEPKGGAHRDLKTMALRIKERLLHHLKELKSKPINILLEDRYQKLLKFGT